MRFLIIPFLLFFTACAITQPIQTAETVEQKAFAAYATWVITVERAAEFSQDAATPQSVRRVIRDAYNAARPAVHAMRDAARAAAKAKREVRAAEAAGGDTLSLRETLDIAIVNAKHFYDKAKPHINDFTDLIKRLTGKSADLAPAIA